MFNDIIGDMEVVSIFDECTGGIACNRATTDGNIRVNVRDDTVDTVDGL